MFSFVYKQNQLNNFSDQKQNKVHSLLTPLTDQYALLNSAK